MASPPASDPPMDRRPPGIACGRHGDPPASDEDHHLSLPRPRRTTTFREEDNCYYSDTTQASGWTSHRPAIFRNGNHTNPGGGGSVGHGVVGGVTKCTSPSSAATVVVPPSVLRNGGNSKRGKTRHRNAEKPWSLENVPNDLSGRPAGPRSLSSSSSARGVVVPATTSSLPPKVSHPRRRHPLRDEEEEEVEEVAVPSHYDDDNDDYDHDYDQQGSGGESVILQDDIDNHNNNREQGNGVATRDMDGINGLYGTKGGIVASHDHGHHGHNSSHVDDDGDDNDTQSTASASTLKKKRLSAMRSGSLPSSSSSTSSCSSRDYHGYGSSRRARHANGNDMSPGQKAGHCVAKVIDGLADRMPRKYRSAVALVALAGLAGMVAFDFQLAGYSNSAAGGVLSSRKLKDLVPQRGSGGDNYNQGLDHGRKSPSNKFQGNKEGDYIQDDFDQRRRRAADLPDGTVFDEPAHRRMCRAIVDRLDAYDAGTTSFERMVFTESEFVCRDPDAPYTSVMNMFAAQLLDAANNALGLNVDYTHRCAKWERYCSGNTTTIQFHLPDPLSTSAYAFQPNCLDAPALRTLCTDCLAGPNGNSPDCVLFPQGYLDSATNGCNLGCQFKQVLPWIRNNLRAVATEWLSTVETRALTFWLRNAAEFSHREKDDMEVAVVSLACADDDCDATMSTCVCRFTPLPNWVYALHIPRSATNVAIVVSPTCAKFGDGCTLHAQELYHFFGSLYPRADITWNVITSTSSAYMRMITADHLVCPPGVGCLLPAIARDAYTYVYETVAPTVSTWITCLPTDYLARLVVPSYPAEFLSEDCRHLRARIGAWTADLDLAPSLQYQTPVDGYLGCADRNFAATAEEPYRSPTTYRWDETVWTTCPVVVATKDELCTQMNRLRLDKILFVGDHTTLSQAVALASLLGQNEDISLDPNVVPNFSKTVECSPGTPAAFSFQLSYVRNDRLEEPGTTPSPGNPNCGVSNEQYCYPWSLDYAAHSGRTLLIVNTGYHWADDWEGYIANFQNFVGKIDDVAANDVAKADDVIVFRTSVPGHKECDLHVGVFEHYHEYCPRIVNGAFWHWWGELPPYNDYAIRIINEWNLLNTVKSGPNIELLDPWMMTILRPDGHLSGVDAGENCRMDPKECMLYSLPGPVDWWNHLLVGQLKDVASHRENRSPMVAWR